MASRLAYFDCNRSDFIRNDEAKTSLIHVFFLLQRVAVYGHIMAYYAAADARFY